jgi:hypothetical protein
MWRVKWRVTEARKGDAGDTASCSGYKEGMQTAHMHAQGTALIKDTSVLFLRCLADVKLLLQGAHAQLCNK